MYRRILIPLENSKTDTAILEHIKPLARLMGSELLLAHVADGWAARNLEGLNLADSEEMKKDRLYLEKVSEDLRAEGLSTEWILATGEPPDEIIRLVEENHIDLIAMGTHGHRWVGDILFGSTVNKVRHVVDVPVLLLKAR